LGKIEKHWPKDEIIKALKRLPQDKHINNKLLIQYRKEGYNICHVGKIRQKFGSVEQAYKEAGIKYSIMRRKNYWTKEKIIEALKKLPQSKSISNKLLIQYKKEGYNICDKSLILRNFHSIEHACKEANIKYHRLCEEWPKEKIIKALRNLPQDNPINNELLIQYRKNGYHICHIVIIYRKFGSIEQACKEANIKYASMISRWPKERIIKALKKLPQDKPINSKLLIQYRKTGYDICELTILRDKFGSIEQACKEAGVKYHSFRLCEEWTKEKIIDALKGLHKKYGNFKPIELHKFSNLKEICSYKVIKNRFGSIKKAFEEAGIIYNTLDWTNERIINTLKQLYEKEGPYIKRHIDTKFAKIKKMCSTTVIRERFGSLDKAAKYAGIEFMISDNVFSPNIGMQETEILDNVEKEKGIFIARQVCIGRYVVDGYAPDLHKIYEVDEPHHKRQIAHDNKREMELLEMTDCSIERIKLW